MRKNNGNEKKMLMQIQRDLYLYALHWLKYFVQYHNGFV